MVEDGHRSAKPMCAKDFFSKQASIRFSELDMALLWKLSETYIPWHAFIVRLRGMSSYA